MIVLEIPVRRKNVRLDGAEVEAMQLVEGFVRVSGKDALLERLNGGQTLISNPLIDAFLNRSDIATGEEVYIRLVPAQNSNAGTDNEQASLNNLLQNVV
jgi:hypothetical protein